MKSLSADPHCWPWGDLRRAIPDLPTIDMALFQELEPMGRIVDNAAAICLEALAPSTCHLDFTGEIHLGQEESQGVTEAGKRSHAYSKGIQLSRPCTYNSSPQCPLLARTTPVLERNAI